MAGSVLQGSGSRCYHPETLTGDRRDISIQWGWIRYIGGCVVDYCQDFGVSSVTGRTLGLAHARHKADNFRTKTAKHTHERQGRTSSGNVLYDTITISGPVDDATPTHLHLVGGNDDV